jgi:hypothetical protein
LSLPPLLPSIHGSDVQNELALRFFCRNDDVKENFDEQEIGCWSAYVIGVVNEVPSECCLCSVGFVLFLLGLDLADKLDVRDVLQSVGTSFLRVNLFVSVAFTRPFIPWANLPNSFAADMFQASLNLG